ncbi:MAG TPA: 3-oxoacyl-ACP reductase [Cytophagales bacterium]|jgi:3-oxoacyl-[acyl-carrier protein] reductase|nr:3-oxoacyl-ACP reductase [Cytophagales bacterium]
MSNSLKGMKILVTGASRGIGAAIAKKLVADGATVAIHYNKNANHANQVKKELGSRAHLFQADLCEPMEAESLFYEALQSFKSVDVVINNAAIAIESDPDTDDLKWMDHWLKTMDVNLNSVALLCKKAIAHFKETGGGRIINVASRAAFRGDTREYMAYAASKAGVVALTRSIARAYGKDNIKAFIVAPGFVKTDMAQDFIDKYGEDYLSQDLALPNLPLPEDIAPLFSFLASGQADHSTGGTFDFNSGSYVH